MQDAFSHFKRVKRFNIKPKETLTVLFQLDFDDYGAYVEVIDEKGKPIEANYLNYSGTVRNVLRLIETIRDKNSFVIDWEKASSDRVYLKDNEDLAWQLKLCKNMVDVDLEPIRFEEERGELKLKIEAIDDKNYTASPEFWHKNDTYTPFRLLTENYVLAVRENIIFEIEPLGNNFNSIYLFKATFPKGDIQHFLSLFYSYLNNISLLFEDYQINKTEDRIIAEPGLVFEKIDENEALYIRIKQVVPSLGVDFLDEYDLLRIAEFNDLEKVISIKYLEQDSIETHITEIEKQINKNIPREGRKKIGESPVIEGNLFIIPRDTASNFIYKELPNLLLDYKVFGTDKLKSYKIKAIQPKLNLKLEHGIDFLEGDAELIFGENEIMSLFEAINQYDEQNFIKLSDGSHAIVNEQYINKLKRIFKKDKKKVKLSFFDLPIVEELIDEKTANNDFKKSKDVFEGFNTLKERDVELPNINATLRPYQEQGYKWLKYLQENYLGGCLADDMGLGKTLQTIAVFASIYPQTENASLVIMPRSLLFNWNNEVKKFAPQLTTYTYYGNERDITKALKANVIFTTYAIARNDVKKFKEHEFEYIVLDESQNIKNLNAQVTKAVMLLTGKYRLALSGTPIENNLGELYSLFRFLNPSMFGSVQKFNYNYGTPIQKDNNIEVMHELRRKIYPFILRRLKKDVLTELPDKIEQVLYVEMSKEQRKFYEQRRQFYQTAIKAQIATNGIKKSQFFIFQALNELRQLASIPEAKTNGAIKSTKRTMLTEHLMDAIANGHKILVFANFLATIELVSEQLNEAGIDFVAMTGSTRNRQQLVERFQKEPNCRVFLMTLKTGGTGLNLTQADMVFIYDPWWNVAAENQAIDRTHRIGQKNTVTSYKMITQDSIEEKILLLQEKKKELFDNIISSDSEAFKSLSEADIQFILS